MNIKVIGLVLGIVAGLLIGYVTRPVTTAAIRVPGINLEIKTDAPANSGGLNQEQTQHLVIWAIIGAIVGFGGGYIAERRR
ncbi:MAG: hypothetical protein KF794_14015 [Xanthobacteraceae bacterium]|nr:hypothetical protein [Xanthobacteraceae bacterium]QYK44852.1 MAG: hypothetical protein KF794_14015 [Xanthobacteraceae bacterium]HMN52493.1 hypothetical protein [Xanthobacteraceae bacterium]